MNIGERSQIKEQDLNKQLCRRLNLGEDLDLGCRDRYREYRNLKDINNLLEENQELIIKTNLLIQDIENLENIG